MLLILEVFFHFLHFLPSFTFSTEVFYNLSRSDFYLEVPLPRRAMFWLYFCFLEYLVLWPLFSFGMLNSSRVQKGELWDIDTHALLTKWLMFL